MDDGLGKIVIQDHFKASTPESNSRYTETPSSSHPQTDDDSLSSYSLLWTRKKFRTAASILNMFSIRRLSWGTGDGQEKVELTVSELESLRSELSDLEEREAHLKAQLEHIDEILKSARLSGYLYIRTRWAALPGEPLPIDDCEVDDWLPRFVVLHGPCIFFYLLPTDLSPQDSTLLSDIVEIGQLSSLTKEDDETWYSFNILTRHGLRYECSCVSKIQVDSWLKALRIDCKMEPDKAAVTDTLS